MLPGGARKASVIQEASPVAERTPLEPTVILSPTGSVNTGPTMMAGVIRKSLTVTPERVQSSFPELDVESIDEITTILSRVVPETLTELDCIKFGSDALDQFGKTLRNYIDVSQSECMTAPPVHLIRMQSLLLEIGKNIDNRANVLWFRRNSLDESIDSAITEIKQITDILGAFLPQLYQQHNSIMQHESVVMTVSRLVSCYAASAEILAEEVGDRQKALLADVMISLTKAALHANEHIVVVRERRNFLNKLVQIIRDRILVAIPTWISTFNSIDKTNLNETQRFKLNQTLTDLATTIDPK